MMILYWDVLGWKEGNLKRMKKDFLEKRIFNEGLFFFINCEVKKGMNVDSEYSQMEESVEFLLTSLK